EGPVLSAYSEAMELFAEMIAGEATPRAPRRIRQLILETFSKHFPHSYWLDWALGRPTAQATPLWSERVEQMPWLREEIGIRRLPTTVVAVAPAGPGDKKRDAVEEMLRIYQFQRRAFHFAQSLPETVGGKLENYGALFVTSADPKLPRLAQRRQILETAEKIRKFASRELEGPVRVGIGESVIPGESLWEPFRQAVWALHLQKGQGKGLAFFRPNLVPPNQGTAELTRLLIDLKHSFETASFANMEEALEGYLKQVLSLSFQNPEEIRWHLHYAIVQAGEAVKGGADHGEKEITRMVENLVLLLEKSTTTKEKIISFKDAMGKLAAMAQNPNKAVEFSSMEKVRDYLGSHFRKPLKISSLAKLAGVSPATFSRWFKKANGVGLEAYLQDLRLNEARRLLKTGSLPISKIAGACGFKSRSYFVRLFRKKTGMAPAQFREKSKLV
ncbi:MAG TPA: AraC family transcriptional regulator, partial [bacterium]|nr:AraC family transcriptional regulator [bacterium]